MDELIEHKEDLGIINFGVHKGKEWNKVPSHYLEWLISDECNTYADRKEMAKKALANKKKIDGQILMFENGGK